ncbi:MAG: TlpA disulfide reductase family protein [Agriterribacter sp.]
MGFIIISANTNAQFSLIQNTIDKIADYKNLSYTSINKLKELFTIDTVISQTHSWFLKTPEDKNYGYLFRIQTQSQNDALNYTDIYDGEKLIHINPKDHTYDVRNNHSFGMTNTLPGDLKWLQERLQKKSCNIIKAKDTMINAINSYHLIVTVYDTIINAERNYTNVDLFINQLSNLPNLIIVTSRFTTYGNGISSYYSEARYIDYKTDQKNINKASITSLKGVHLKKEDPDSAPPVLLASGDIAPDWTLYNSEGEKITLGQLKGKVVLMDFFFIGCFGCMESLKPLNALHQKYKNENVAIVSMTFRDSKKAVTAFKKNYAIQYPIYLDTGNIVNAYHVIAFPTFYFIDKEGKIANVIAGYDEAFEENATSIINNLLNK